ncbi:hypothetical protein KIW84_022595 [Lathyrus oleraceus]|uniref:Myosin motor domain-containing protein n=1 Tax=Pisum sativum TaxID=3888 RepID=A0A9D4YCV5_PEA|nr:hypothetical protein KIW84_022595 [Pisum sativum]
MQHVFKMEQEEYTKEEIDSSYIEFVDNQDVLDLIEKKPGGVIALLDEAWGKPWYEPDWWKFGDEKSYFRHASGSLVILSKNLAHYININRSAVRNESIGIIAGVHWSAARIICRSDINLRSVGYSCLCRGLQDGWQGNAMLDLIEMLDCNAWTGKVVMDTNMDNVNCK